MKNTPAGWPRISVSIFYPDAAAAIDWLVRAFGFEVRLKIDGKGGAIDHSELTFGGGVVMVGTIGKLAHRPEETWRRSPHEVGGANTQALMVYVDDIEAHCARARAAGATIAQELETTDYGEEYWADRGYQAVDIGGHRWSFYQRLRSPKSE